MGRVEDYTPFLSQEARRFTAASLAGLINRFAGVEGVVSLAGGLPPPEAFPLASISGRLLDGSEVVLGAEGQQAYWAQQYNFNPQGYPPLLDWLRGLTAHLHPGVTVPPPPPAPQPAPPAAKAPAPPPAPAGPNGAPASSSPSSAPAAPSAPPPTPPPPPPPPPPSHDLVLTCGAIHAICCLVGCLTDPGDVLVVDEYTYTHALECVFLPRGLRLLPVAGDEEGMSPEDLERQLTRLQRQRAAAAAAAGPAAEEGAGGGGGGGVGGRARLLYLIPTGHNPTGAVMSEARKRRLLQVAEAHDLLVLEDDAYYWLYFPQRHGHGHDQHQQDGGSGNGGGSGTQGGPGVGPDPQQQQQQQQAGLDGLPRSLLSLDMEAAAEAAAASGAGGAGGGGGGRVIRVDTFSKCLGPGYRLGWITAPRPLVGKLANWIMASTVGPCSVSQVLVWRLLTHWGRQGLCAYLQRLQALYAAKAAAAHAAAAAHLAGLATWSQPRAGMFMWLQLAGVPDVAAVLDDLVAARVVVVPGAMFATRGLQATVTFEDEDEEAGASGGSGSGAAARHAAAAPATATAPSPCLRLSFAGSTPEVLAEGLRRLAAAARQIAARRAAAAAGPAAGAAGPGAAAGGMPDGGVPACS